MMLWECVCVLSLVVAPAAAVVGGAPAAPPEPDAAVVFTQRQGLSCRLEGLKDDLRGYYTFAGIRYAEPPVGQRRFQRPVRQYLAGEINATRYCAPCPQLDPQGSGQVIGQEDCLCLNVFAPKMPGDEQGSPVVIFIHGGNYRTGSATQYGGQHLAQKDTILVSVQYRLGSLGFLSTAQKDASGNVGLFDIRSALEWVKEYIEFFGGDPSRVVVAGHGSGGSAASLVGLTPEGRSAGVVALSGAPLSPGAIRNDTQIVSHAEAVAEKTGCPKAPPERLIMCLRMLPMEKIVQVDKEIKGDMLDTTAFLEEISGREGSGPRPEGKDDDRGLPPLVEEEPNESLKKKRQRSPMLTGVVSAETSRAVYGKYSNFLTQQAQAVKDFIKKDVIGNLRGVMQTVKGLDVVGLQNILPLPDYYNALLDTTSKAVDVLSQVVEATGDALFNFPAYQSVREWSAGAPAFLYSFEHMGNLTKGSHFLPGLALTQGDNVPKDKNNKKAKGPSHGDELAYLFEPLDDEGRPIATDISSTDQRVRDSFVSLIVKFAHSKTETNTSKAKDMNSISNIFGFVPYSADSEQFLKIGDKITVDKNFRFCQMGLWGNMGDRIAGEFCKNILGKLLDPSKLVGTATGLIKPVDSILNQGVPGLSGQGQRPTGNQNQRPSSVLDQGLGGLLGPSRPKPTPAVRPMWGVNPLGF
ncbi:cocaine esterase [Maniola hyperantus]|uniref:cocaine esterase n=1 Tax=Aphantopus hyperantus TaxID=2795564 RepID=UPI001567F03D|nr:liver carboxylesterase 2 [Maniola hyperantus]